MVEKNVPRAIKVVEACNDSKAIEGSMSELEQTTVLITTVKSNIVLNRFFDLRKPITFG